MSDEIHRGRNPGAAWVAVTRGAHRMSSATDPVHADLLAWQSVLPSSAVFTHLTAACHFGLWVPPLPRDLPVFVAMNRDNAAPIRPGVRATRHHQSPTSVLVRGLRIATMPELLLACSRDLGLLDLVVMLDSALHLALTDLTTLTTVAARHARGAPCLRRALGLADGRSESPWESMLRLLHVTAGVNVEPQHDVHNEMGDFLARADLWIVGTRTIHEYDGGHHLERRRQRRDLKRVGNLDRGAWSRRGFTKEDLLFQGVSILREADRALGREHDPSRIRAWHRLLVESLQTPAGMARFRARLGLSEEMEEWGAV